MNYLILIIILNLSSVSYASADVTKKEFEDLGSEIVQLYEAEARAKDWVLNSVPKWSSSTSNASLLTIKAPYYELLYYGGLIKKNKLSKDALSVVLCHEMGHLYGKRIPGDNGPLSTAPEGEADYFATQNCLKRLWVDVSNEDGEIPASEELALTQRLAKLGFRNNSAESLLARRIAIASFEILYKIIPGAKISFAAEDKKKVSKTLEEYPSEQCRLDSYLAGIANKKRPSCWYR